MSNLDTINVGGIDFDIEDSTSRANSISALNITAYKEDGDTASQAYSVIGTPINWKGSLYYTSATIAAGATLAVGTNLIAAANLGKLVSNIKTYVNNDGELVFRDLRGADTVLPFSSGFVASYGFGWVAGNSEGRLSSVYGDGSAGKIVTSYRDTATLSDSYATWQGTQMPDYGHIAFTSKVPMVVSYTFSNGAKTVDKTLTAGQRVEGSTQSAVLTIVKLL